MTAGTLEATLAGKLEWQCSLESDLATSSVCALDAAQVQVLRTRAELDAREAHAIALAAWLTQLQEEPTTRALVDADYLESSSECERERLQLLLQAKASLSDMIHLANTPAVLEWDERRRERGKVGSREGKGKEISSTAVSA